MNQDDIELPEPVNAWKPATIKGSEVREDKEDRTTEILARRFRGVLNKLTPAKIYHLMRQIDSSFIDTRERLERILSLIFDAAVSQPVYCVEYAKVCRQLSFLRVSFPEDEITCDKETEEKANAFDKIRRILVRKCRYEYSSDLYKSIDITSRMKEIEEANDPEKKKVIEAELDEEKHEAKERWLGFIRFIGQLYMYNLLSCKFVTEIVHDHVSTENDLSLECLCTLLRIIGSKFEDNVKYVKVATNGKVPVPDTDNYFLKLQSIVGNKPSCISSRVRSMIEDILVIRSENWKVTKAINENEPKNQEELDSSAKGNNSNPDEFFDAIEDIDDNSLVSILILIFLQKVLTRYLMCRL